MEVGEGRQGEVLLSKGHFKVLEHAVRPSGTKPKQVIGADCLLCVGHLTLVAEFAEAALVEWTLLSATVRSWNNVPVDTVCPFLTVAILKVKSASGNFVFLVAVEVFAVGALLALVAEPVNADDLSMFGGVGLSVLRLVHRDQLVETQITGLSPFHCVSEKRGSRKRSKLNIRLFKI